MGSLDDYKHIGIFILRFFIATRLMYGVVDNIIDWDSMEEFSAFLKLHDFPFPIINAALSVYIQFFGAVLILIGFKTRISSLVIAINFLVALIFVHFRVGDTIKGMTPALAMFFGSLTLLVYWSRKDFIG